MNPLPKMLGSYPVERELGRGGMGVVYLARDPRLNRPVAIKVLSTAFAQHPEYLARFEREAKLLASLTHPNVASIYGVEEAAGGEWLLLLEYVPGDTLAERLARGPLPLEDALEYCRQIAVALEAAHEAGVIHRDLKPGNVKITPDGQVKVLDFGLAKGSGTSAADVNLAMSPTFTDMPTAVGVILGTAGYMSPEQARGKPVDRRTDIWSFGCVLYECLTGARTFDGETTSDTIARILEREPDWSALPPRAPERVRDLLRRCLEKDPKRRQRDIGDVRIDLEEAIASRSSAARNVAAPQTRSPRVSGRTAALAALAVLAGAAAAVAGWTALGLTRSSDGGALTGPVRLSVNVPPTVRATGAVITPDGRTLIVFGWPLNSDGTTARPKLYTRRLNEEELKPLPGTEDAQNWALSTDGAWIAFVGAVAEQSSQRRLSKMRVDGSAPPVALTEWDDAWRSFTWLANGDFLISANEENGSVMYRLPGSGGSLGAPVTLDKGGIKGYAGFGKPLPGDRGVFVQHTSWGPRGYQNDLWMLDPGTAKATRLLENAGHAVYVPTGHVLFSRGETLMAAPFDLDRLALAGEVTALTGGLRTPNSWDHGLFTVSQTGILVHPQGGRQGLLRQLVTVDAAGSATAYSPEQRPFETTPAVSRDGRRVAVVITNTRGTYEIWVSSADKPVLQRLIAAPNADTAGAVWSPDGTQLAYGRQGLDKEDGIYLQRADGGGAPRLLLRTDVPQGYLFPLTWTADGTGLVAFKGTGATSDLLYVTVPPQGEGAARPLRATPANEFSAQFSPDGRLLAFVSDASGRSEVYVSVYQGDGTLGPPLMVSNGACDGRLAWAADSRRLFYCTDPAAVMMVSVNRTPSLSASAPTRAYDLRKLRVQSGEWSLLPDGRLFAIQQAEGEDGVKTFNIVLNWFDELKQRMSDAKQP